eukprot:3462130-Alexandrium_andersonii.AAC.1
MRLPCAGACHCDIRGRQRRGKFCAQRQHPVWQRRSMVAAGGVGDITDGRVEAGNALQHSSLGVGDARSSQAACT